MSQVHRYCPTLAVALMVAGLLAWPTASRAQTVTGEASAVQATTFETVPLLGGLLSTTTSLADTGTLTSINDALDASQLTGSVLSLLNAETLSAATISWPDQVDSEASLANLNVSLAGVGISADFVMAQASQVLGAAGTGSSELDNLSVNGVPVFVTGELNQVVGIPGGQMIINEQTISSTGQAVVNALHVSVSGVADMVIASATAGIS
ncbi:MAG TPA: choice-of-anchor P family protein [Terriglobales bacterium]|nr:choice-of-anchor P family protein [Terriglobales bacterium]